MSAIEVPSDRARPVELRRAPAVFSATAAGLFVCSAVLLLVASLQRWVVFRLSHEEFEAEDHLYDYSYPYGEWVNIGVSAQLFGVGILIVAVGILAMALGVTTLPRASGRRSVAVVLWILDLAISIVVAGSFSITGAHALISGISGTPSALYQYGATEWVAVVGLIVLAVRRAAKVPTAMLACVFLIGTTGFGYFVAAFQIASLLAGYTSHDTTPWTETVVAVWTAVAAFAMVLTAREAAGRRASGKTAQ